MLVTGWPGGSAAQTAVDSSASISSVEQILKGMVERLIRRNPCQRTYEHGPVLWTLRRLQLVRAGLGLGGRPRGDRSPPRFLLILPPPPPPAAAGPRAG